MQVTKKVGGGVGFARKEAYEYDGTKYEADLKNGDIVTILNGGLVEPGKYGQQTNFKLKTRNGEKKLAFNQATINVLHDELGSETESWINKNVIVILQKKLIAGEKAIVPYLVTEGWKLDEYGELVKEGGKKVDTIEYPSDDIDPADIPF